MCEYSSYWRSICQFPGLPTWCGEVLLVNNNMRQVIRIIINYLRDQLKTGKNPPLTILQPEVTSSFLVYLFENIWLLMRGKYLNKCSNVIWSIIAVQLIRISKDLFSNICSRIIQPHQPRLPDYFCKNINCRRYCNQLLASACLSVVTVQSVWDRWLTQFTFLAGPATCFLWECFSSW